jgi:hypothetical protein
VERNDFIEYNIRTTAEWSSGAFRAAPRRLLIPK